MDVTTLSGIDLDIIRTFGLLLVAIAMAVLLPLPVNRDPLLWFGQLAHQVALKVGRRDRAASQQYIAGTLAILILVLPFWIIVTFIPMLAAYPWFFELVILYLCLNNNALNRQLKQISIMISKGDKQQARQLLASRVPFNTSNLSSVGLSKTAIEMTLSLPATTVITVSLGYLVLGVPLALMLRMLTILAWQWPLQAPELDKFAIPIHKLNALLLFIPNQIWKLLLALQGGPLVLQMMMQRHWALAPGVIIGAQLLQCQLGGPQIFGDTRVSRPKTGPVKLPQANDIIRAINVSRIATGYFITLLACLPILWFLVASISNR